MSQPPTARGSEEPGLSVCRQAQRLISQSPGSSVGWVGGGCSLPEEQKGRLTVLEMQRFSMGSQVLSIHSFMCLYAVTERLFPARLWASP